MKRLLFMLVTAGVLILSAFVSGCGGGGGGGGGYTISGTIQNWNPSYTLKAFIGKGDYGTVQVDSQGRFTYQAPTPRSEDLEPIEFDSDYFNLCDDDDATPNILERPTVSPNNARIGDLEFKAILPNGERNDLSLINPNFNPYNPTPNTPISGGYTFFDRNVIISGSFRYECPDGTKVNIQFDPQYSQGWNYIELVFVSFDQGNQTLTFKVARKSQPDPRLKWIIEE